MLRGAHWAYAVHVAHAVLCWQVSCVAWRPLLSSMLAVGVEGGVALWSLTPSPLAGGSTSSSSSGGVTPAWVTFLPYKEGVRWVSACAWIIRLYMTG